MNGRDQGKLLRMGILIIRERDYHPIGGNQRSEMYQIYYSTGNGWALYKNHKYTTKVARRRAMDELLKDDYIVED